jgi:hypothetical protein
MLINAIVTNNIELLGCPTRILPLTEVDVAIVRSLSIDSSSALIDLQQLDPAHIEDYAESADLLKVEGVINSVAFHVRRMFMMKIVLDVNEDTVTVKAFDPSDNLCETMTGLLKNDLVHMMESAHSEQEIENLTLRANTRIGATVTIIGRVLKETYTNDKGTEFTSYVFRASNRHNISVSALSVTEDDEAELTLATSATSSAAQASTSSSSSTAIDHVD